MLMGPMGPGGDGVGMGALLEPPTHCLFGTGGEWQVPRQHVLEPRELLLVH